MGSVGVRRHCFTSSANAHVCERARVASKRGSHSGFSVLRPPAAAIILHLLDFPLAFHDFASNHPLPLPKPSTSSLLAGPKAIPSLPYRFPMLSVHHRSAMSHCLDLFFFFPLPNSSNVLGCAASHRMVAGLKDFCLTGIFIQL